MMKKILCFTFVLLIVTLNSCSDDSPSGGDTPTDISPDPPEPDADDVVDDVLSWFTKAKYEEMAPLSLKNGTVPGMTHEQCHCYHNKFCSMDQEFYNYDAFVKALKNYPDMFIDPDTGKGVNQDIQQRLLAAYFANVTQETNGEGDSGTTKEMLCWAGEAGHDDTSPETSGPYCTYGTSSTGYCFNGRGPLQLTGSGNYSAFSQAYFGDDRLSTAPQTLTEDPAVAFASSFWFFSNYRKGAGWDKGISPFIIHPRKINGKKRDFTYAIYLINGGYECKGGTHGTAAVHRVNSFKSLFKEFTGNSFNEPENELGCADLSGGGDDGHLSNDDSTMTSAPYWED